MTDILITPADMAEVLKANPLAAEQARFFATLRVLREVEAENAKLKAENEALKQPGEAPK